MNNHEERVAGALGDIKVRAEDREILLGLDTLFSRAAMYDPRELLGVSEWVDIPVPKSVYKALLEVTQGALEARGRSPIPWGEPIPLLRGFRFTFKPTRLEAQFAASRVLGSDGPSVPEDVSD